MSDPIEILISLPFPEPLVKRLRDISPRLKITVSKASKAEDISADLWEHVEILYTSQVLPPEEKVPNLRWIQFHWAGVDHILHEPVLHKEGLVATTLSGANATQVAEYIVMMLLSLGRHIPELVANQKRSEWPRDRWERFSPKELRGSTVGLIGYGSIGRQTARLLVSLGATVLAVKRDVMHPQDYDYAPEGLGDAGGDYVSRLYPVQAVRSMIKECDFVVVCLPKTKDTLNFLGPTEFNAMKPTVYLVDVSRGGVVDHNALIAALKDHKISGAALDVFPEEPLPPESPLWKFPNVLITPHISGITPHFDERAVELFGANIQRYLAGLPLYNRIDLERGY
jgi:phosphoglycerate dehydrogenase-like enzyme